jgi:putative copper export protein
MTPDLLGVIVRALGFVALFQAVGAAFFLAGFGDSLSRARTAIARLGRGAAAVGTLLVLAHLALDSARLAGDFAGLLDQDMQRLAWTGSAGLSQMLQALGLIGILVSLRRSGRSDGRWASLGGVLAVGGFLVTGHTRTQVLWPLLSALLGLHLLIVAFWFGSLAPLALVMGQEPRATAARVLSRFSVIASWSVPLILVAGLAMAWLLVPSLRDWGKPYGELLIAKLAGFALLMVFAAINKWRLTPAFRDSRSDAALRWSITVEFLLIVTVLSFTAVLTTFHSPS